MSNVLIVLGLMIIVTLLNAVGSLFLKLGSKRFNLHLSIKGMAATLKNWRIVSGAALYVCSAITFILVLKITDLSIAYPMSSMAYIFITILSYYFLKEKMNRYKIIGIVLIIMGVVLVKI